MGCTASRHEEPKNSYGSKPSSAAHKGKKHEGGEFQDNYLIGKKLGVGTFGQVHVATKVNLGQSPRGDEDKKPSEKETCSPELGVARAVKIIDLRLAGPKLQKLVSNEVHHWKALTKSTHCIHLFEVFNGNGLCYMVMERCNASLLEYLESTFEYDERFLGESFLQMLLGIKALHERHLVHRDIKPGNFVVGGSNGRKIKVGDFGLASWMPKAGMLHGECGTPPFMSPEMCCGIGYDFKTDMWSFGVMVYALLFGRYPYPPKEKDNDNHHAFKRATEFAQGPPDFKSSIDITCNVIAFAMSLLKRKTDLRPLIDDALNMSYMVASSKRKHAPGHALPDLAPALTHAKKLHFFQASGDLQSTSIDAYLNKLQMDKWNVPVSEDPDDFNAFKNQPTANFSAAPSKAMTGHATTKSTAATRHNKNTPTMKSTATSRTHLKAAVDSDETSTTVGSTIVGDSFIEDGSPSCEV